MCSPGSAGIVVPAPVAPLSDRGAAMAATLNAPPPLVRVPRGLGTPEDLLREAQRIRHRETQACERPSPEAPELDCDTEARR